MLLPIKAVCKRNKVRRDGTSVIFIQYCFTSEKRTLLNTEIAIPPAYWHRKRLCISADLPEKFGKADELNRRLQEMIRLAEDIATYARSKQMADPCSFLKLTFKPGFDLSTLQEKAKQAEPATNLDVFYQIDDYIKAKTKQVSPKMVHVYRNMRETLKAFENFRKKPITFESFDFNLYEEFVEYMMYDHVQRRRKELIKGFRISSIGKTIKHLRVFLRNRMRKKIIPPINLEDFKILDEESDAVYLPWNEIIQIYQADLTAYPHLIKYRDLFVFGCLTGLRFSDFSTIKPIDVRNGMLYKKQGKSDHWVVIPLRDEASKIFVENFKRNIPQLDNGVFNRFCFITKTIRNCTEIRNFAGIKNLNSCFFCSF